MWVVWVCGCGARTQVLVSVSHDRTMRFWDLHTRHEMDVVERAHDTPIHTLAYCEENEELATAAHEPIVKIWCSFKHSLKAVLTGHKMDVSQVRPPWCGVHAQCSRRL